MQFTFLLGVNGGRRYRSPLTANLCRSLLSCSCNGSAFCLRRPLPPLPLVSAICRHCDTLSALLVVTICIFKDSAERISISTLFVAGSRWEADSGGYRRRSERRLPSSPNGVPAASVTSLWKLPTGDVLLFLRRPRTAIICASEQQI